MKTQKIDELVKELEMQPEIQPLLDSNANGEMGYDRFVSVVNDVLDEYKFHPKYPTVPAIPFNYEGKNGYRVKTPRYISPSSGNLILVPKFDESADIFKRFYGFNGNPEDVEDIVRDLSKEKGVTRSYGMYGDLEFTEKKLRQRINAITRLLKRRKEDLWQGSL
tara:strand:- start:1505 stop:1996 length:492 start_codon:yes stop_codon:yes gene_type:complete